MTTPDSSTDAVTFFAESMQGEIDPGFRALQRLDPEYLHTYQRYAHAVLGGADQAVSTQTRELVVIALLAGTKQWELLRPHMRRALRHGVPSTQIMQILEITTMSCGMAGVMCGGTILEEEVAAAPAQDEVAPDTPHPVADARVQRNGATFRRLQYDVIAGGRDDLIEEIFAPQFQTTRSGLDGLMAAGGAPDHLRSGDVYADFRAGLAGMRRSLGDQRRTIEELHGAGDYLWAKWRITATHSGVFLGKTPTGKRVEFIEVGLLRFDDDGRIVEGWYLCDEMDLAGQLGLTIGEKSVQPPRL